MAKPYLHAQRDVSEWGGKEEDYLPIHDFMDSSKSHCPDGRHRVIFHTTFGCFIVEKVFGHNITNSDGKKISVRDIAEKHILMDFRGRFIPTLQDYLDHLDYQDWMNNIGSDTPSSKKENNVKNYLSHFKEELEKNPIPKNIHTKPIFGDPPFPINPRLVD